MLTCLIDGGWDAKRSWGGGVEVQNYPESQRDQLISALDECADQSGWSGGLGSLSSDQIAQLYEQEVEEFRCLNELGYEPEEPPTFQTYLDTFMTGDQYYAYAAVVDNGQLRESIDSMTAKCPPPTWFLNLDGF